MAKRLILYDFGPEDRGAEGQIQEDFYFPVQPMVERCLGCFGCWVQTPGRCAIQDRASALPQQMKRCDQWIIISPVLYGGYSLCVKAALERCLGYMLPYLRIVQPSAPVSRPCFPASGLFLWPLFAEGAGACPAAGRLQRKEFGRRAMPRRFF